MSTLRFKQANPSVGALAICASRLQHYASCMMATDTQAQLGNLSRVITSRSIDRQTTDSRLMSKREVKIAAVEWAISALLAVDAVDNEERKEQENAKLKEFIQSPFLE